MERVIDKGILLIIGLWLLAGSGAWVRPVVLSLCALGYLAVTEYEKNPVKKQCWGFLVIGLCLFMPDGICYLPLVCYSEIGDWQNMGSKLPGLRQKIQSGILWSGMVFCVIRGITNEGGNMRSICMIAVSFLLSSILAMRTERLLEGREKLIHLRDESTEVQNGMKKRQRELMERQDYEIHLATLRERNRIAREIHDNVGHMLTRSILQVGALEVVYKDQPVSGQLHEVNDTLNEAMNNIRSSVRDLHDESMDLKQSVKDAAKEISQRFSVHMDYDLSDEVPRNVKYCMLAITKEALSNINRHCNGDRVSLIYREHPAFCQLAIHDNGTDIHKDEHPGIGLMNMEERVEALHGHIHFSTDKGFGIMVTIPKEKEVEG